MSGCKEGKRDAFHLAFRKCGIAWSLERMAIASCEEASSELSSDRELTVLSK